MIVSNYCTQYWHYISLGILDTYINQPDPDGLVTQVTVLY